MNDDLKMFRKFLENFFIISFEIKKRKKEKEKKKKREKEKKRKREKREKQEKVRTA